MPTISETQKLQNKKHPTEGLLIATKADRVSSLANIARIISMHSTKTEESHPPKPNQECGHSEREAGDMNKPKGRYEVTFKEPIEGVVTERRCEHCDRLVLGIDTKERGFFAIQAGQRVKILGIDVMSRNKKEHWLIAEKAEEREETV